MGEDGGFCIFLLLLTNPMKRPKPTTCKSLQLCSCPILSVALSALVTTEDLNPKRAHTYSCAAVRGNEFPILYGQQRGSTAQTDEHI